jgi:hypothetical protein
VTAYNFLVDAVEEHCPECLFQEQLVNPDIFKEAIEKSYDRNAKVQN